MNQQHFRRGQIGRRAAMDITGVFFAGAFSPAGNDGCAGIRLFNRAYNQDPQIVPGTEFPIEEPDPDPYPAPVEEPDYPDDPGPAEDPEEQPVKGQNFSSD
jgi:hypothetical protein